MSKDTKTSIRTPVPAGAEWVFIILVVACVFASVALYNPLPMLLPVGVVFGFFIIARPKLFYRLFFFLLPFSIEFELPGGFATDLPSEPLMLVLSFIALVLIAKNISSRRIAFVRHPISLLLFLHIFWILISSLDSSNVLYSIKFLAAKIWYVLPFYVLPLILLDGEEDYRNLIKWLVSGLLLAIAYVMVRHGLEGFSFKSINQAVRPIFRNHVNYGVMLVSVWPFLVYVLVTDTQKTYKSPGFLGFVCIIYFLAAIYLTYTRAAQISVILSIGIYFVVKWRLARAAILLSVLVALIGLFYLSSDNKYLDIAPDYTKAIEHKKFDNLVEATTKMEDISTVERFYRWIAGINMVKDKPLTGFGPSTFYSEYKAYTITSYKTYVSDNPEKSGIHNYYLMTAVEQGIPGFLIFFGMCILCILYAEKNFHLLEDAKERALVMATAVSFVLILAVLLINDLLEADKVGPFFFLCMAIVVSADIGWINNKKLDQ